MSNLTRLGVVSPVIEIERFSQPWVMPDAIRADERLGVPVSRYNFEGSSVALAGKENEEILKRSELQQMFSQSLAQHAQEIESELARASKRVDADPVNWINKHVLSRDPKLSVFAVGQMPYFQSDEAVAMMKNLWPLLKAIYPYRPVVLVTPYVAQDVVLTAESDFALLQQDVQLQAYGTPQIVQAAAQSGITVVGAGLRSHQASNGSNYVFYGGKNKEMVGSFSDTALGQKEQALYLKNLLQKYRYANPNALLVLWAPSEFVTYNGYVSVTDALVRLREKTKVLQISHTEHLTRFEQALPADLKEQVVATQGVAWSKSSNTFIDWISGMDALIRLPAKIEMP